MLSPLPVSMILPELFFAGTHNAFSFFSYSTHVALIQSANPLGHWIEMTALLFSAMYFTVLRKLWLV